MFGRVRSKVGSDRAISSHRSIFLSKPIISSKAALRTKAFLGSCPFACQQKSFSQKQVCLWQCDARKFSRMGLEMLLKIFVVSERHSQRGYIRYIVGSTRSRLAAQVC